MPFYPVIWSPSLSYFKIFTSFSWCGLQSQKKLVAVDNYQGYHSTYTDMCDRCKSFNIVSADILVGENKKLRYWKNEQLKYRYHKEHVFFAEVQLIFQKWLSLVKTLCGMLATCQINRNFVGASLVLRDSHTKLVAGKILNIMTNFTVVYELFTLCCNSASAKFKSHYAFCWVFHSFASRFCRKKPHCVRVIRR